jgi:hypothetical protein
MVGSGAVAGPTVGGGGTAGPMVGGGGAALGQSRRTAWWRKKGEVGDDGAGEVGGSRAGEVGGGAAHARTKIDEAVTRSP